MSTPDVDHVKAILGAAQEFDEIEPMAADFEDREFTPDELAKIKKTRRRSPRIGEARA